MQQDRRILIVGTGAMATLFAWRLARAGSKVTLLGSWRPGLDALRRSGARLVDARGPEQSAPVGVAESPEECAGVQQAIVLVKSWQTQRAATQLEQCLSSDGLALTLQNGLVNFEILAEALGSKRVALGTTTAGATLLGPGLVKPAGNGSVSIQAHPHLGQLPSALRLAGFKVEMIQDAQALLWSKLVINSAINPLTALLRVPNGELLRRPTARALMRALAEETAAIAAAEGIHLAFEDAAAAVEGVARETAGNYSSMLQDVQRGAPTEIDAICGAIVQTAQRQGRAAPLNEACWRLVAAVVQTSAQRVGVES